jgi:hypothetical protein
MEFWLSKPFSRTFPFLRWNSSYHEAFLMNFSFFHDGILASRKPFLRTFLFFHDGVMAIRKPFSRTFLFFTMEFWLSKPFSRTFLFSRWNYVNTQFGGRLFSYIYITKSIYIGSASLKTLPQDLEPPLQGKEYGPPYSNAIKKVKANFFPKSLIDT